MHELAQILGSSATHVRVIDISSNTELERKYGHRVPVLMVDGEFVCAYRLDRQRVEGILAAA